MQLINGGTLGIDSPRPYSAVAAGLLKTLGIDPWRSRRATRTGLLSVAGPRLRGLFRQGNLRRGSPGQGQDAQSSGFLEQAPLSAARAARHSAARNRADRLPARPLLGEKKARLSRISYRDYLLDVVKVDPSAIALYQSRTHGEWGVGIDAVSALDVWAFGLPGFKGLNLEPGSAPHMGYTAGRLRRRRLLQIPFPRRQRQHRAAAGTQPDPASRAGQHCRRRGHRAHGLWQARSTGGRHAHPARQHVARSVTASGPAAAGSRRCGLFADGPALRRPAPSTACSLAGT